jgi:hypothetical protein
VCLYLIVALSGDTGCGVGVGIHGVFYSDVTMLLFACILIVAFSVATLLVLFALTCIVSFLVISQLLHSSGSSSVVEQMLRCWLLLLYCYCFCPCSDELMVVLESG